MAFFSWFLLYHLLAYLKPGVLLGMKMSSHNVVYCYRLHSSWLIIISYEFTTSCTRIVCPQLACSSHVFKIYLLFLIFRKINLKVKFENQSYANSYIFSGWILYLVVLPHHKSFRLMEDSTAQFTEKQK